MQSKINMLYNNEVALKFHFENTGVYREVEVCDYVIASTYFVWVKQNVLIRHVHFS